MKRGVVDRNKKKDWFPNVQYYEVLNSNVERMTSKCLNLMKK